MWYKPSHRNMIYVKCISINHLYLTCFQFCIKSYCNTYQTQPCVPHDKLISCPQIVSFLVLLLVRWTDFVIDKFLFQKYWENGLYVWSIHLHNSTHCWCFSSILLYFSCKYSTLQCTGGILDILDLSNLPLAPIYKRERLSPVQL